MTETEFSESPPLVLLDIRHLTVEQLAGLGVSQIAYVKSVMMNGTRAWAIHAADGTPMALVDSCDIALAAVAQNEMRASLVN